MKHSTATYKKGEFPSPSRLGHQFANLLVKRGRKDSGYTILLTALNRVRRSLYSPKEGFRTVTPSLIVQNPESNQILAGLSNKILGLDVSLAELPSQSTLIDTQKSTRDSLPSQQRVSKQKDKRYFTKLASRIQDVLSSRTIARSLNVTNMLYQSSLVCQSGVDSVKPRVETRKVRRGRVIYQVPFPLQHQRQEGIALRWLIASVDERKRVTGDTLERLLANILTDSIKKQGKTIEKRNNLQKAALYNRAYSHFRW